MRSIIQHTFAEELKNNSGDHTFMHQTQLQNHTGLHLASQAIDHENMIAVDDEEEDQYAEMAAQDMNR